MICSLTAFRRPDYLDRALDSLHMAAEQLDEPLYVCCRIEPSDVAEEMAGLVEAWLAPTQRQIIVNHDRLGACGNTLAALDDAWALGEDFVYHHEEDFVLAPDALRLVAWMRERYRDDQDVFCTGLWHRGPTVIGHGLDVHRQRHFSAQGWGTWRDRWDGIRPQWRDRDDPRPGHYRGWDVVMDEDIRGERCQVFPCLPRLWHCGEQGGQHTTPAGYAQTLPLAFAGHGSPVTEVDVPYGEFRECA